MERGRSSHRGLLIAVILLIVILSAAVGVLVNMGFLKPHRMVVITSEKPAPEPPATDDYAAASSWKVFVDDARAKCAKEDPNYTVDYTALHDYGQDAYGVMIVGAKDSEYVIDLYRYDPSAKDWTPASKRAKMDGYEVIDTAAASQAWGVPESDLAEWISSAEKGVQHAYEQRAQQENKH